MGKETDLLHAVKNGDVSFVRKALQKYRSSHKHRKASKKSNINLPDADGFTILHHAALGGNVEVVMALIEMEADPNARDKKGMCPLHMAAWAGKDQAVKCLLESNALVNLPSFNGETAIHLGSQHGYASAVDFLLKFKADPTIRSNTMETPLDLACQYGHIAVVRLLLKNEKVVGTLRGRHDDPRHKSPLHLAAKSGHADIVRLLIESGADVNEETMQGTCLHHASLYGKTEVVRLLLEAGADVNALNKNSMTPLDIVNKFTTSRAGIEIKQMLREAAGERIVYARAQSSYHNIYDNTCLSFKAGETITVLEQNEDGRWKGSIISNNEEKIGYFPAQLVSLISERTSTPSRASAGSLDSALSHSSASVSLADKENLIPKESAKKTVSTGAKAVGVVPIGSYELLTLSTGGSTSQKQRPTNVPRMSSFKRTMAPVIQQRTRQGEDIFELEHRRNTESSQLERPELREQRAMTYDVVPGKRRSSIEGASPRQNSSSIPTMTKQDSENGQERCEGYAVTNSDPSLRNYAEVVVTGGQSSLAQLTAATEYTEVCIGNDIRRANSLVQSSNSDISSSSRYSYDGFQLSESKLSERTQGQQENGKLEDIVSRLGSRTPEEKRKLKSDQRAGYEDMHMKTGYNGGKEETAPALPRKMGKGTHDNALKEVQDLSTLKRIESRGIRGRQDTYENFSPRIIPVATHNPFSGAFSGSVANSIRDSYGNDNVVKSKDFMPPYENYCPGLIAPPVPSKPGRHSYENVVGQPCEEESAGETEIIPLPPKSQSRQRNQTDIPKSPLASPGLSDSTPGVYPLVDYGALSEADKLVFDWLTEHKLACYFENFQKDGFDMISICGLTPEDLNAIGINKAGHRKKILSEVTKLELQTGLPSHKPDDVGLWLSLMGMQQYEENFIEGGFDDIDFIKDLDRNDLEMIEIKKKGHQRKLLMGVKKLAQLELTSSLDKLVDGTSCFPGTDESSFEFPPPPSLPSPIPPPPPVDEFDLQPISQREHLPPPPGAESESQSSKNDAFSILKDGPVVITTSSRTPSTSSRTPSTSSRTPSTSSVPAVSRIPLPSSPRSPSSPVVYPLLSGEKEDPSPPKPPQTLPKPSLGFKSATSQSSHNVVVPVKPPRSPTLPTRSGTLPPPKTKPKPVVKKGQVQTAAEYHGNTKASSSRGVVFVGPSINDPPHEEDVTPAKLREFWGLSTQEPEKSLTEQHIKPHRTCSVSSGKAAPIAKPVILPKPKRRNTDSELKHTHRSAALVIGRREFETEPLAEEMNKDASLAVRSKVKRAAPPAPPKEDIVRSNSSPNNDDVFDEPCESGWNKMKSDSSSTTTVEKNLEEISDVANDDFKETDVLMADIDNLIADFSTQLESMF